MTKAKGTSAGPAQTKPTSKIAVTEALLRRPEGATLAQLVEATGWQSHSMRGAMSGNLKKKRGLTISSTTADGVRVYRVAGDAA